MYRTSATKDPKKPERVFYAEWIRDCYYFHLNAFYKSVPSVSKIHDSLLLFFNSPGASSSLFNETRKFAEVLQENQLASFFEFVESSFQRELESVPHYLRRDSQGLRTTWLSEQCSDIMQEFLRNRGKLWQPEVRPEDLESPEMQSEANGLLVLAQGRDMTGFDSFLEETVRGAYKQLAPFVEKIN